MGKNYTLTKTTRNFGGLTDLSKSINYAVGDRSGRSLSMRSAHGFKRAFNLSDSDMDDNTAEDILHAGMLASGALLFAKNDGAKVGGFLLLLALFACYQNGRD